MDETKIYSAPGVWKDFDAESLELDVSVISDKSDSELTRKWVFFNGRKLESGAVSRVLALIVCKVGTAKLPALVVVPPSGQPIDEEFAVYWADKGYAVIAVDNAGESDSTKYTVYPEEVKYANYIHSGRHLTHCDTTAKETCWYEWAVNARRAVTFIAREPYVNAQKIGLLGLRDGAFAVCMAGAFDKRLASCAVLSGSCYSDGDNADDRWQAGVAPQSYVMFMNVPFYVCSGTNSDADIDRTYRTLLTMPEAVPRAMLFVPGTGDETKFLSGIEKWFELTFSKKKIPVLTEKHERAEIFYAGQAKSNRVRYWSRSPANATVSFRNVTFKNGLTMSSNAVTVKEDTSSESSKLVYMGSSGETAFFDGEVKTGPFEIAGAAGKTLSTFKLNDPNVIKESGRALTLDVHSGGEQDLKVLYVKNFGTPAQTAYCAQVGLLGGNMWQKVRLEPSDFHIDGGRPPENWNECELLSFTAEEEIIVNNLLFT